MQGAASWPLRSFILRPSPCQCNLKLIRYRAIHTAVAITSPKKSKALSDELAVKRQRRTEWKRKQRGQTFLDHLVVHVRAGKGGDGCVAFHREKFVPNGPPSGGNGGRGGDIYIVPSPHLTTLSSIPKHIRGQAGTHGKGTWMNGRNAPPVVIEVPFGTVVQEIKEGEADPWGEGSTKIGNDSDDSEGLSTAERVEELRKKRWVHYPGAESDNLERDAFKEAEKIVAQQERERAMMRRQRNVSGPISIDFDSAKQSPSVTAAAPSSSTRSSLEETGHLVASGGVGGLGNPTFLTMISRSPKFATRGEDGERITLSLELKILADVGLVGFPNAGKSTLLKALTCGRARTEIAGYAFTTLNPVVGVVRIGEDGSLLGESEEGATFEETKLEEARFQEMMERGELATAITRNQRSNATSTADEPSPEAFRFTVADNPGLVSRASENVGLGHSFLRSIERALALVYVIDLSGPNPLEELRILRDELEQYKPGLSLKARMVIANKADLLESENEEQVAQAKDKLRELEEFVKEHMRTVHKVQEGDSSSDRGTIIEMGKELDVVPISAKLNQNVKKVVRLLQVYIQEARAKA